MGKTKYSRKNLVGKKKNNTIKKKYPKKQKGKKLKNNKKIKMKKKANKIKRKYSLKVKKQRGGSGGGDDNNVPTTCSLCLNDIQSNAIIVSKPNKDGDCPNGFKEEGDFCVSTNIKDSKTTEPEAPVETNSKQNSNLPSPSDPSAPPPPNVPVVATPVTDDSKTDVPVAVVSPVTTNPESVPVVTSTLDREKQLNPNAAVYYAPSPQQFSGNKTNNSSSTVIARNVQPIEVKETTKKSLIKNPINKLGNKVGKARNAMTSRVNNGVKSAKNTFKRMSLKRMSSLAKKRQPISNVSDQKVSS
jgi:hypothetical protein